MKIISKVKIAGHEFRVKYPHKFRNNEWAGDIDHDKHVIRIANCSCDGRRKSNSEIRETFLHEIVHGINRTYLYGKRQLNEDQVGQITKGLYQVLKDNKIKIW